MKVRLSPSRHFEVGETRVYTAVLMRRYFEWPDSPPLMPAAYLKSPEVSILAFLSVCKIDNRPRSAKGLFVGSPVMIYSR